MTRIARMRSAADIMTKNVITVNPETSVLEAAELLVKHAVSGLPVVDRENHIKGILSEKDLLKLVSDQEEISKTVADYMTSEVVTFNETDSVASVSAFLMSSFMRRVPIVNNRKLVGVVSRRDIIKEVLSSRSERQS